MTTERLYYRDPTLLEFEAEIVNVGEYNGCFYTVLDRTAFYPTSGGQMNDTGRIDNIRVVDVIESEAGDVWHISEQTVGKIGQKVGGVLDADRRWKHRQTHTAQHIISAAFFRLYGLRTASVHLGEDYSAVEPEIASLTDEQLAEAEKLANEVVQANSPIEILFVEGEELERLPLRKPSQRQGMIRVIKIGEFDWSACGGTHCSNTAEVGFIKIIGCEKIRGRISVRFLAGRQAFNDYTGRFAVTDALTRSFTCHVNDLPAKVEKLSAENKHLHQKLHQALKDLLPVKAAALVDKAEVCGKYRCVVERVDDLEPAIALKLATGAAKLIDGVVMLLIESRLVLGVSEKSGLHAGNLANELAVQVDLKGGGSELQAQLGGADADKLPVYKEHLVRLIGNA